MTKSRLLVCIVGLALVATARTMAASPNLLNNGDFDQDVAGWTLTQDEWADLVWLPIDVDGSPTSGAMGLVNHALVEPPTTLIGLPAVPCVPVEPGQRYVLSAFAMIPLDQPEIPGSETPGARAAIRLQFSDHANCTFSAPFPPDFMAVLPRDAPPGQWTELVTGGWAQSDAAAAHVALSTAKGPAQQSFMVALDRVRLVALPFVRRVPMLATSGQKSVIDAERWLHEAAFLTSHAPPGLTLPAV